MRPLIITVCLLLLASACGGGDAAVPSPSGGSPFAIVRTVPPTPTPAPTPAPTPSPSPTPVPPPRVDLSLGAARQGGFLVVRLLDPPPELLGADVLFNGGTYPMLSTGDHWYRLIGVETWMASGDYPIEVVSATGMLAAATAAIAEGGFEYESIDLPPSSTDLLSDQAAVDAEKATLNAVYAGFTATRAWSGAWRMPADGVISNAFGLQRSINGGPYYPHSGTDVANDKGTPVYASAAGTVALARPMYLYGNVVIIDHGAGVFTSYNHLDGIAAAEGQLVPAGALIGYMGETGFVNGPHVHWEAVIGGVHTDPMIWVQGPVEP